MFSLLCFCACLWNTFALGWNSVIKASKALQLPVMQSKHKTNFRFSNPDIIKWCSVHGGLGFELWNWHYLTQQLPLLSRAWGRTSWLEKLQAQWPKLRSYHEVCLKIIIIIIVNISITEYGSDEFLYSNEIRNFNLRTFIRRNKAQWIQKFSLKQDWFLIFLWY